MITAGAALLVASVLLGLGRRDLTRPAVAFGVPWFAALGLAQLRLTELEEAWSIGFTLVAFGGGLAFVVAATLAGGTAAARGRISVGQERLSVRRLVIAAAVLVAAGVAGAAYKAHLLGGVPLLSENPDLVRGRAFLEGGLPAWSSALTGGFYLGMWSGLAALSRLPAGVSKGKAALWLLVGAALFGVALDASRNLVVFALAIPAIGAYLLARPRPLAARVGWIAVAAGAVALGVGGLFAVRVARGSDPARAYLEREANRQAPPVRPLVPVYLNAVYPLEAARRVHDAVPRRRAYGLGANSLTSLPAAAFPEGKADYGTFVAGLMRTGERDQITWSVAGYQGRLLADLGWQGVLLGSILLGLAFGSLHRWARARTGFLPVAVIAYVAYYSAFMLYDNQLSFTLIGLFDLAAIAVVVAYATERQSP